MGGPMELNRDFSEFIACFTAHDVRFLIVGGYAVAAHGHPRYTKDLGRLRDLADIEDLGLGTADSGGEAPPQNDDR